MLMFYYVWMMILEKKELYSDSSEIKSYMCIYFSVEKSNIVLILMACHKSVFSQLLQKWNIKRCTFFIKHLLISLNVYRKHTSSSLSHL